MKKFLSLVLALVMAMSLVTVSAGAKDFNDGDKISGIAYEEAVNVMSEMGIIDGYGDGNFQPQGTLTRGAAAKIIACMMLGKTTAEALGTQAAPFKDVPVGSTFAGYIAYCSESGIIDGYSDGTFRPGNTLTGFAFLKMLLTALGYDSDIEGYANNPNWTVNVAGRAKQIGLLDGNDNFVGTRAATREEACLYAVNALQATLVEYTDKGGSISVGDITINTGASNATYVTSNIYDQATSIDATRDNSNDWTVEFAEKYQPDLRLDREVDAFGRPSHTWTWKRVEIGSYIDQEKLVTEYTTEVTGRDLYNLLGSYVIENDTIVVTIDGVSNVRRNANIFGAAAMVKSNDDGVGATGNGVLTQVFRDAADGITYIAIINTYLAEAADDFDEKDDVLDVKVYGYDTTNDANIKNTELDANDEAITSRIDADNEDVPVADYEDGDIILVRIADGEILEVMDPEVLADSTVTAFSVTKNTITSGGTTYDQADTRLYEVGVLDEVDDYSALESLKNLTYNIILDPYGYFIGLELNEDPDEYVFITGYDPYTKNLSTAIADAGAIFLDGTMKTIEVEVDNDLARQVNTNGNRWLPTGDPVANTWYTYTVDSDGVYSLEPVAIADDEYPTDANNKKYDAAQFAWNYTGKNVDGDGESKAINKSNISLPAWAKNSGVQEGTNQGVNFKVAYGNADTVYLTVGTKTLTNTSVGNGTAVEIINKVKSTTVGVKNADITVDPIDGIDRDTTSGGVYTLYGDDNYIIASVVVGDDAAASSNYAFITSTNATSETYNTEDDEHIWTRTAIVNGAEVELKEVGDGLEILGSDARKGDMQRGEWYKVYYNADDEVIDAERVTLTMEDLANGIITLDDFDPDQVTDDISDLEDNEDIVLLVLDKNDVNKLTVEGQTLKIDEEKTEGFAFADDAKAVLIERVDGKQFGETTFYDSKEDNVADLLDDLNTNFNGYVFAVFEDGLATSIIVIDDVNQGDPNLPVVGTIDSVSRDNVTMNVYNDDANDDVVAESVRISSKGTITFNLSNVDSVDGMAANDEAEITYTVKVEGTTVLTGSKVVDVVAGEVVDSIALGDAYDEGDDVVLNITEIVPYVAPVEPTEDPTVIVVDSDVAYVTINDVTKGDTGVFDSNYVAGDIVTFTATAKDTTADITLKAVVTYADKSSKEITLNAGKGNLEIQEGINTLTITAETNTYALTTSLDHNTNGGKGWSILDNGAFDKKYEKDDPVVIELQLDTTGSTAAIKNFKVSDGTTTINGAVSADDFEDGAAAVDAQYDGGKTYTVTDFIAAVEAGNLYTRTGTTGSFVYTLVEDVDSYKASTKYYTLEAEAIPATNATVTITFKMPAADFDITTLEVYDV